MLVCVVVGLCAGGLVCWWAGIEIWVRQYITVQYLSLIHIIEPMRIMRISYAGICMSKYYTVYLTYPT